VSFMNAKKPILPPPHLYEMAKNLNLERRLHPRARLPIQHWVDFTGPRVVFKDEMFAILDLSEGGLCLEDQKESFKDKVGQNFELIISCGTSIVVPCRLVGSNLSKRHIQFTQASSELKLALREWVQVGLRGQWLSRMEYRGAAHPILWSSTYDDSLTLGEDPRFKYQLCFNGEVYLLSKDFWPVTASELKPISVKEFDFLLVGLSNLLFKDEISQELMDFLMFVRRRSFE
jgi:hypothetical protein